MVAGKIGDEVIARLLAALRADDAQLALAGEIVEAGVSPVTPTSMSPETAATATGWAASK